MHSRISGESSTLALNSGRERVNAAVKTAYLTKSLYSSTSVEVKVARVSSNRVEACLNCLFEIRNNPS